MKNLILIIVLFSLSAKGASPQEIIEKYFAAENELDKAAVLAEAENVEMSFDEVAKYGRLVLNAVRKNVQKFNPQKTDLYQNLDERHQQGAKMGKTPKKELVAELDTSTGKMRVMVIGRNPKSGLLIYLHGGGHVAGHDGSQDNEMSWGWGVERSKELRCARMKILPRCIDDTAVNAWIKPDEARAVGEVIDVIAANYPGIDTNKIYLAGISMGGFGVWNFGAIDADRYAAIASWGGGCIINDGFVNFRNTKSGIFIGENDTAAGRLTGSRGARDKLAELQEKFPGNYQFEYKEYPGTGHSPDKNTFQDMNKFFNKIERNPYPKELCWIPQVGWKKRFYNLYLNKPVPGAEINMSIKDNVVEIKTSRPVKLTVLFNSHLVDIAQPVEITLNGNQVFNNKLTPSFATILQTLGERCDPEMYYTAKVAVGQ